MSTVWWLVICVLSSVLAFCGGFVFGVSSIAKLHKELEMYQEPPS